MLLRFSAYIETECKPGVPCEMPVSLSAESERYLVSLCTVSATCKLCRKYVKFPARGEIASCPNCGVDFDINWNQTVTVKFDGSLPLLDGRNV